MHAGLDPLVVTAFFSGLIGLIGAVVGAYVQLRKIHQVVNSRMDEAVAQVRSLQDRLDAVAQTGKDPGRKRTRRT